MIWLLSEPPANAPVKVPSATAPALAAVALNVPSALMADAMSAAVAVVLRVIVSVPVVYVALVAALH